MLAETRIIVISINVEFVHDHLIIEGNDYYSFAQQGKL